MQIQFIIHNKKNEHENYYTHKSEEYADTNY
jgi:hypothetical protein